MPSETGAASPSPEVLAAFDLRDATLVRIPSGKVNAHWRIEEPGGSTWVLRRYAAGRMPGAITWEHALIAEAAAAGWPVAKPARRGGASVAAVDGSHWALFPFLAGSPMPLASPAQATVRGRLLARLHRDLAAFPAEEQRPGFGRAWELDQFVASPGASSFADLLRAFDAQHPAIAYKLKSLKYRSLRELARLGYGELPARPVHGDFQADHLLYDDGQLSGLLDFDSSRLDAQVADIASSIALDCQQLPAGDAINPGFALAFVSGYAGHRPLSEAELRLVVPLIRAAWLLWAVRRLEQWFAGDEPDRAAASLARTVERRVPALDILGPPLTEALLARQPVAR